MVDCALLLTTIAATLTRHSAANAVILSRPKAQLRLRSDQRQSRGSECLVYSRQTAETKRKPAYLIGRNIVSEHEH